jgi:HSP20 family protein
MDKSIEPSWAGRKEVRLMAMLDLVPTRGRMSWLPAWDMFDRFFQEVERPFFYGREDMAWVPPADMSETGEAYVVTMDVPGIDMKDLDISYANGILSVTGNKKSETTSEGECCYCSERYTGSFQRTFRVRGEVDPDHIDASYKDGVLKVTLPKSEASKPKKIEVKH